MSGSLFIPRGWSVKGPINYAYREPVHPQIEAPADVVVSCDNDCVTATLSPDRRSMILTGAANGSATVKTASGGQEDTILIQVGDPMLIGIATPASEFRVEQEAALSGVASDSAKDVMRKE